MTEPMPVVALGYHPGDDAVAGLTTVVRGVAWLLALTAGVGVAGYVWAVACYAWQDASMVPAAWRQIEGWPLVWSAPLTVTAAAMLVGAIGCHQLREHGRRLVLVTAAIHLVLGPLTHVGRFVYSYHLRQYPRFGWAYVAYSGGGAVLTCIYYAAWPIAVWLFFRHPAVRRCFGPE